MDSALFRLVNGSSPAGFFRRRPPSFRCPRGLSRGFGSTFLLYSKVTLNLQNLFVLSVATTRNCSVSSSGLFPSSRPRTSSSILAFWQPKESSTCLVSDSAFWQLYSSMKLVKGSYLFVQTQYELQFRLNCSVSIAVLAVVVVLSARTIRRNDDWRTAENLYRSALHLNPAKGFLNN